MSEMTPHFCCSSGRQAGRLLSLMTGAEREGRKRVKEKEGEHKAAAAATGGS